ncbi:MAG TPA: aldehyde dehydrogenase family protein, partial [Pirellulaceae bacterium]
MLTIPVLRWGQPYKSLETKEVVDFSTGAVIACVGQANGGLVARDLKRAQHARDVLRALDPKEVLARCLQAAELFLHADLALGIEGETQSPVDYAKAQSASTGLPQHLCLANMRKNAFVLSNMPGILDALTRGLDLAILSRGYGQEPRGVTVSYQAQSPVLGAVLPSNSPGVHSLWLPAVPLQIGLVLKPGSSEPWTPYRLVSAFVAAGIPAEAFGLYPGDHDVGASILSHCRRSMIFGSEKTVEQYSGNPRVQVHGPGFSKILLGDDQVDNWQDYLDVMVESILSNAGRSCINASAIFASRHTQEIAAALAQRLGPIEPLAADDPGAQLAAFTNPEVARGTWSLIENDLRESG